MIANVSLKNGKSLLEVLREREIYIASPCGGEGLCGGCKVIVVDGYKFLNPLTTREKVFLTAGEIKNGYRLACQTFGQHEGNISITVPKESKKTVLKIIEKGLNVLITPSPAVKKILIENPHFSMETYESDFSKILNTLPYFETRDLRVPIDILRELPNITRNCDDKLTLTVFKSDEIIDIECGNTVDENYGVAIDIGTTTVVAYLVDLNVYKEIAALSSVNPQLKYGEDIISRMNFARKKNGLEKLKQEINKTVNELITELCEKWNVSRKYITEVCIVGNTVMHHLFLGISIENLVNPPYAPSITKEFDVKGKELVLNMNPNGNVHLVSPIGGFIGSDFLADIIVSGLHKSEDIALLIDLGTNGEIALGNQEIIHVCSTAAGPAFEGVGISCGMMAADGAIDHLKIIDGDDILYTTIGNIRPKGICGTGMIDALSEFRLSHIVNKRGRLIPKSHRVVKTQDGELGCVIATKEETATNKEIILSQKDIDEILLAKGAIRAGCEVLMKKQGVTEKDIKKVFLAGAFGSYINKISAVSIGIIPEISVPRIFSIGNAAGTGAKMFLFSTKIREEAREVRKIVHYIDLMKEDEFDKIFALSMYLP